jgi:23S rRNA (guanosine2251-2'-O)-methyltransferase
VSEVYGLHAVMAVLEESPGRIRALHVLRGKGTPGKQAVVDLARDAGIRINFVDRRQLDRKVEGAHQGVVADCHDTQLADEKALQAAWPDLPSPRLILVLDGVQDPRNLGACLRSAKAAGVQAVLLPKRKSAPVNAAAIKTAAGAAEGLLIVEVSNLARRMKWLQQQGVWIIGAASDAEKPFFVGDFSTDTVLVVGGEEKGLRRLTREHCDELVSIPMSGGMESLNVSVAAGILLFEAVRQRA